METFKYNTDFYRPIPFDKFIDQFVNKDYSGSRMTQEFTPKVDIAESDTSFEIQLQLRVYQKNISISQLKEIN